MAGGSRLRAAVSREYRVVEGYEGIGSGEGCPLPSGRGLCLLPENFWNFLLEMVHFGEFYA